MNILVSICSPDCPLYIISLPFDSYPTFVNSLRIVSILSSSNEVPSPNNPNSTRTFPNNVSFNCPIVIRDGIA